MLDWQMKTTINNEMGGDGGASFIHRLLLHKSRVTGLYSGAFLDIPIRPTTRFQNIPFVSSIDQYIHVTDFLCSGPLEMVGWRGQSDIGWRVDSGMFRTVLKQLNIDPGSMPLNELMERSETIDRLITHHEEGLVDYFRNQRFGDYRQRDLSALEILATLQHFGASTRLLDFTENALVALWFACNGDFDRDGVVVAVSGTRDISVPLQGYTAARDNIVEVLRKYPDQLRSWQPSYLYERMRIQQSLFVLGRVSISAWGSISSHNFDAVINNVRLFHAIGIPAAAKLALRASLKKLFGYHNRSLFPDLQGFARSRSVAEAHPIIADPYLEDVVIEDDGTITLIDRQPGRGDSQGSAMG